MIIKKSILEAKIQVDVDNYDKVKQKLGPEDIVSVIDEDGQGENVTYVGPMKGENPFDHNGNKYVYVWGLIGGKKEISVLSLKDDTICSKKSFDAKYNI